jgi:glycosyltransferase involved in cell wall biosynthesis
MSARVLHILPHPGGGGETYLDMLERLPEFEHQRSYLSAGRTPARALASMPAHWAQIALRVRGADMIHAHGDVASAIALPLLRSRPAVMTTHGLHMLRRVHGPGRALANQAICAVVRRCRAVICTSVAERDELAPLLPATEREKLRVIRNGVDLPAAIDEQQRISVRAELGVDPETVLGLFIGQLEPRKAPLLAARAAVRVHAAGISFELALAGDGPQALQLGALAGDAVRVLGYRSDVDRLLAAADVFVQPSEREGISFALLEAMGHGLAVVAADGPGNPEVVDDAGLLFRAADEDALVAALTRICSESDLRASLGALARTRVRERFSAGRFLAASEEVYRQVLGDLKAPGPSDAGSPA